MCTHIFPQLSRVSFLVSLAAATGSARHLFEARFVWKTLNLCFLRNLCSSANFQGTLGDREELVLKDKSFHNCQRNHWFRAGFKIQYVLSPSCF